MAESLQFSVLDVDLLSDNILFNPDVAVDLQGNGQSAVKRVKLDATLKERFLERVIDPFWHSEKDQLDHFQYYNNGLYRCQRRKLKHDFSTGANYWSTYEFKSATKEQAAELNEKFKAFYESLLVVREEQVYEKIDKIDDSTKYFQQKYMKAKRQKNDLLSMSDWRILPDVEDHYEGQKDEWIAWRAYIRNFILKNPGDFDNNLAFFRYTYDIKYPVDPKIYRTIYPNAKLEDKVTDAPAFMDVNDPKQWVKHDYGASSDFVASREQNMYNLSGQYRTQYKKVKESVLEIMKLLNVEDVVPIDWSLYYVNDSDLVSEE